jgi:type I restriction enzyme M protein
MFLHNINYDNFDIRLGDTLLNPLHRDFEPFDAIVSNPPYSIPWEGSKNPLLINDDRYAGPGVLAPDSTADLAFTLHMLRSLSESGTAAIVEFPGVLYRGGKEKAIRHWLVENNYIDTIIQLPANLFFGVGIATCIIVLRKGRRPDNSILFIDASKEFVKNGNKNKLTEKNQDHIFAVFSERKEEQYFSRLVPTSEVLNNDSNLSVSSYVEQEDTREVIDIAEVNATLEKLIAEGNALNEKIAGIVKELEK